MKLSIADKLALIYTSAGSMRKTAALAGLSHQQVSRILHAGFDGKSLKHYEKSPGIVSAVDTALQIHTDLSRQVARAHGLPFDGSVPVYTERLKLKNEAVFVNGKQVFKGTPAECKIVQDGRRLYTVDKETGEILRDFQLTPQQNAGRVEWTKLLGDRVAAQHLHWVSDRVRNAWLRASQKSGKYYHASIGSTVNLKLYNREAEDRAREDRKQNNKRTKRATKGKHSIKDMLDDGLQTARVFTPYVEMNPEMKGDRLAADLMIEDLADKLKTRHEPALGSDGVRADMVLFQIDTRKSTNATKPGKAKGSRGRSR